MRRIEQSINRGKINTPKLTPGIAEQWKKLQKSRYNKGNGVSKFDNKVKHHE
jgi:hypothetical protein